MDYEKRKKTFVAVVCLMTLFLVVGLAFYRSYTSRQEQVPQKSIEEQIKEYEKQSQTETAEESEAKETEAGVEENQIPSTQASGKLKKLHVKGTKLLNSSGKTVQLVGVSTHGLAWFPQYVNQKCFNNLKSMGANAVRLAMYTNEYGGYCSGGDKKQLKKLVKNGVRYATKAGLYVIIDWHILSDGNPKTYQSQSKKFFAEMSKEFASYNNVLYEICNEPNGGTSWSTIKSYAKKIIPVIRKNDKDAVIIVGTPNWSQYVEEAAASPIKGYKNIMYSLHFYAGTHKQDLRDSMVRAIKKGLPIFVSEYGICDASGNGNINKTEANKWVKTLDKYKVSYMAWSFCNKDESASLLKASCQKTSGFKKSDLSTSGKWLYKILKKRK